jgi:hypothetical protein
MRLVRPEIYRQERHEFTMHHKLATMRIIDRNAIGLL